MYYILSEDERQRFLKVSEKALNFLGEDTENLLSHVREIKELHSSVCADILKQVLLKILTNIKGDQAAEKHCVQLFKSVNELKRDDPKRFTLLLSGLEEFFTGYYILRWKG